MVLLLLQVHPERRPELAGPGQGLRVGQTPEGHRLGGANRSDREALRLGSREQDGIGIAESVGQLRPVDFSVPGVGAG